MKYGQIIILITILSSLLSVNANAGIKILFTAAIVPHEYEMRKNAYTKNLLLLKKYGYPIYVVESIATGPSFLESYCDHVYYSQSNDSNVPNRGINESKSMLLAMNHFQFDPEDILIKITGRYALETREFIELIENNLDLDACVRQWSVGDVYTALFAIKAKHMLEILTKIDFQDWFKNYCFSLCFEQIVGRHVAALQENGHKIVYLPRLYSYLPSPFAGPNNR